MTRINGNDGMKNVYFGQNSLNVGRTDKSVRTEQTAPTTETSSIEFTFNVGSKQQADQIRSLEVEGAVRLDKTDMEDLDQLAQLIGIKNISVTQTGYDRIKKSVVEFAGLMDDFTTTSNAEALFKSSEFGTLNTLFGIS